MKIFIIIIIILALVMYAVMFFWPKSLSEKEKINFTAALISRDLYRHLSEKTPLTDSVVIEIIKTSVTKSGLNASISSTDSDCIIAVGHTLSWEPNSAILVTNRTTNKFYMVEHDGIVEKEIASEQQDSALQWIYISQKR